MSIITKTGVSFFALFLMWGCSDSEFSSVGCQTQDSCNTVVEKSLASWHTQDWSRCSLACGGGQATRSVECRSTKNIAVPDSECSSTMPPLSMSCNNEVCEADYSWNVGPYTACSQTCGGGVKSRDVTCQSRAGVFTDESSCTEAKPTTSTSCNVNTCPENTFSWIPSSWGSCSQTCGGGTYLRSVTCQNGFKIIVDDSHCTLTKPSLEGSCNTQSCSYAYNWVEGNWGTCSQTCDSGTQSRSQGCRRDDGLYVPHTLCTSPRPTTSRPCNTQTCPPPTCTTTHQISKTTPPSENQLDILLVIDDSGSMYQDILRLATKLGGFVNNLSSSNVDWQMCITTTSVDYFEGRPIQWQSTDSGHILTRNSGNLGNIFTNTITWIGAGFSPDEQGIKAVNLSLRDNARSNCYREDAGLAIIIISDEDERSVGGVRALNPSQYRPLKADNQPSSVVNTIRTVFGTEKRVSVHPIIVKDAQCKEVQDAQGEASFYGTKYNELYSLIGGSLHSICEPDFSVTLSNSHTTIVSSLSTLTLNCTPNTTPTVLVNGVSYGPHITVIGDEIIFNPVVSGSATITGSYCCQ